MRYAAAGCRRGGAAVTRLLVRGGRVIDPGDGIDLQGDVLVDEGRIVAVETRLAPEGAEILDARGLVVCPGFVDPHAHLCEPGGEHRETIATGALAAAAGGYTAVVAMPDTDPVVGRSRLGGVCRRRGAARDGREGLSRGGRVGRAAG